MVLGSSDCSFHFGTVAYRINVVVVTSSNNKWEHVIRLNNVLPIACTMRCHEPDKNVNRLAVGSSEDLGR